MSEDPRRSVTAGELVSHYRIVERIGAGGMGEVYRARDTKLGRQVALKFLPEGMAEDAEARTRLEREARAASALDHPNICTIHDIDETDDGRLFIAMSYYDGQTLEQRLARGPVPVTEAIEIARRMAAGLQCAHGQGIIHRDLKPSNVLLTADGETKILDFGVAKLAGAEDLTRTGTSVGTLAYMAPEQVEGGSVDARTDVWGLGVVLYEMLTGRRPFEGTTPGQRLAAVLTADPAPPASIQPGIPKAIGALVLEMLAKNPGDRPGSAQAVAERLAAADLSSARPAARAASRPRRRRHAALTVVAILALGAVAVLTLRGGDGETQIDSIAVLPFENTSPGPEGEYLSRGITENLIDRLSRIAGLRVVPRGVSFAYESANADLRKVGERLNVRALVTGRVGQVGDRMVVRAELTDVGELAQLWGAQYDRPMADILAVQDSLAQKIADQLRLRLSPEDERRLVRHATDNPEAYRLILLSRFQTLSASPEGAERGRQYAEQAVRLDPGYAPGWAVLAESYTIRAFLGFEPPEEGYARAREYAERALALDDSLAAAHMALGFVEHHWDWNWEGALAEFERAVALDSTNSDALQGLSQSYLSLGRVDEAVKYAKRAWESDPITPIVSSWLGVAYADAGRYEEALEAIRRAREMEPNNILPALFESSVLQWDGRDEEAIASLDETLEKFGLDAARSPRRAMILARAGRDREARAILARIDEGSDAQAYVACAWGWLGEPDLAFDALTRAIDRRDVRLWWIKTNSYFDPLRDDARFAAALRRMGLLE